MEFGIQFLQNPANWEETQVLNEVRMKASLSGGSGGQNVNKVSSKMELYWTPANSQVLNDDIIQKIIIRLSNRLSINGELRLVCDEERSQFMNKEKLIQKFYNLLASCMEEQKPRKASRPTRSSIYSRLNEKKIRKDIKKGRGKIDFD